MTSAIITLMVLFTFCLRCHVNMTILVNLNTTNVLTSVDTRYLSIALGMINKNWKQLDFNNRKVINMAKALSPAYVRLGGTGADLAIFNDTEISNEIYKSHKNYVEQSGVCKDIDTRLHRMRTNFTITKEDWTSLNEFTRNVNWTLLFDVNVILKRSENCWDSSNFQKLLKFSSSMGYSPIAWELGNEPNAIYHQLGVNLTSKDLGKDFHRMKKQLNSFSLYNNSLVVGPDINHLRDCIKKRQINKFEKKLSIYSPKYWASSAQKLIKRAYYKLFGYSVRRKHTCKPFKYLYNVVKYSKNSLNALTWHQYYLNGHNCTQNDFLNVTVLENLRREIIQLSKFLSKKKINIPIWLGETSSAYGGGAPGLSDRYIAGFLWLDKLGLVASLNKNYKVIIRQTFYHGHYALIGGDLQPNPDFWISVLHKRLVSENVLKIRMSRKSKHKKSLRLYAHCASCFQNSVTLFGLNLSEKSSTFKININSRSIFNIREVHHYILEADKEELTSRSITLNGRPLKLLTNDSLPTLEPVVTYESPNRFTLPAYGMGFWVFINSTTNIC